MPGPIPRPEATLARPRERTGGEHGAQAVTVGERLPVTWGLDADPAWHPIAIRIYEAARTSGQSAFYQDSDWAILYSLCEDISYYKTPSKATAVNRKTGEASEYDKPRSGQMLQSIMSNLTSLLLTEGERRRVRLELQTPPEERPDLKVVAMKQYRDIADA